VCGLSGALVVLAVVWLLRWGNRRDERQRADASIWTVREVPQTRTACADLPTSAEHPALGFRDLYVHFDGQPTAEQAQIVRRLNGRTSPS
jgi:hypothetical protein